MEEPLAENEGVAAVRLDVHEIQDHRRDTFAMERGVTWRWTDEEARARDEDVRGGLRRIGSGAA